MDRILELKEVTLNYQSPAGETKAVDKLSFSVNREEFVALVGPSGCGKTTVLSMLAGLIPPSDGEILLNGAPLKRGDKACGLMPQRDQLFEWRTILKNVMLGPEISRTKTKETMEFATALLKKYGLKDFMKKHPSELSGGMRQRAALIRTLVPSPSLLLLDEPFSALDFQTRLSVCDDVHRIIKEEKKTAVMVTHDISEAISMADKVVVLTSRPATLKAVYHISHDADMPPLQRRETPEFGKYFQKIWHDLEGK